MLWIKTNNQGQFPEPQKVMDWTNFEKSVHNFPMVEPPSPNDCENDLLVQAVFKFNGYFNQGLFSEVVSRGAVEGLVDLAKKIFCMFESP